MSADSVNTRFGSGEICKVDFFFGAELTYTERFYKRIIKTNCGIKKGHE